MSNHSDHILTSDDQIATLLRNTRRIAVLGIKPETHAHQPAFYVPKYMADAGYEVIPVPVYYPEVTQILGREVYREVDAIPGEVDLVNVFRRSQDVAAHTEDILKKKPKAVWLQSGIRDDRFARVMADAGIDVVQDLCLMVEHRALLRR